MLENHHQRRGDWDKAKTICVVTGHPGCGKTTYLLHYFQSKRFFYFTFKGLNEPLAEKLLAESITDKTGISVQGWAQCFAALSRSFRTIILDDLSVVLTSQAFKEAFYTHLIDNIYSRPFSVLLAEPADDVGGLADKVDKVSLGYFSIPEVMKLFPTLSKIDILGLCAVSGGIPGILKEYDPQCSFEDNLRSYLTRPSAFLSFMPELLSHYFRKPEVYHQILSAIAEGNLRVSEIGRANGFAYNKCDNYLSALVEHGLVRQDMTTIARGAPKTAYRLANSYYGIWHCHVYRNQTELQLGNAALVDAIVQRIIAEEVHAFHVERAFAFANAKTIRDLNLSFGINWRVDPRPVTVRVKGVPTTFDAIAKKGERAIFIKVLDDPAESCGRVMLERLRKAVDAVNVYYDSLLIIFSKRRFSDVAVAERARDASLTLVEVDRLKY